MLARDPFVTRAPGLARAASPRAAAGLEAAALRTAGGRVAGVRVAGAAAPACDRAAIASYPSPLTNVN